MTVRVVEAGCLRFGHRRGLWRRGGSPSSPVTGVYRWATPRAFARLNSILTTCAGRSGSFVNGVRRQQNVVQHMRALPHGAVADALATVRASKASVTTKRAFEFLVLTAARSGEVRLAT